MKRFRLKIALFTGILLLVMVLPILVQVPIDKENMLHAYADKVNRLQELEGERLIIIGGSNVTFGINSAKLADATGKPVVNMGLHAGLGLKFCMEDLLHYVRKGDVVIVSPEYQQFKGMFYGRDVLLIMVSDVQPELKSRISPQHWWKLRNDVPPYVGSIYGRVLSPDFTKADHTWSTVYNRSNYNTEGDMVGHHGQQAKNVLPRKVVGLPEKEHFDAMISFRNRLKNKGVKFIYSYPSYPKGSYEKSEKFMKAFEKLLRNALDSTEILGNGPDYAFEHSLFFNTVYHLTEEGKELRTKQMVKDLTELSATN